MCSRIFCFLFILLSFGLKAQVVQLDPTGGGPDEPIKLIFDASLGNAKLAGESKVYIHHGVVTSNPDGTDWNYVIGNWGEDDGLGEMTKVDGEDDIWEINFNPTLRSYFGVPSNENIFRISCVFRSADGTQKGTFPPGDYGWGTVTSNLDYYINLNNSNYLSFSSPSLNEGFYNQGEDLFISANASSEVSQMELFIDEGAGYISQALVNSGIEISYSYEASETKELGIKINAIVDGEELEIQKNFNIVVKETTEIADFEANLKPGINYDNNDNSKATLILQAPGKSFVYLVGDMTDWIIKDEFQLKQTTNGEYFWIELNNLEENKDYVFQYWVDGIIKIGDPYADQTADPWNDKWIEDTVFPNLPQYDKTENSIATVLQTGQEDYNWASEEESFERPDVEHLVIYELLVRDFLASHSYNDLIDTLDYIKNLGVDAIELMPISEFEGNESWGYNPSYYFAPDKYYGTKNDLKKFIEEAHKRGLAVILDMVLNHAYGECPLVRMYFNEGANKPTADNPWFNENYVGQYQWGYDFNHESAYTQEFMDRLNRYWLDEYHFDGFRFDFTKGFTNNAPGGSVDGFDQSRIDILKRMADVIWEADESAYIILEHWAPANEENILGDYGMKMWRNRSYDFVPIGNGITSGNFNDLKAQTHVSFFDSHDEQRLGWHMLNEGKSESGYDIQNPSVMFERAKLSAAFLLLQPGPKMMWQFDELGYDIDIDFNGRVGNKPIPWGTDGNGYYDNELRRHIYTVYSELNKVRKLVGPEVLANVSTNHKVTGITRRLSFDTDDVDIVLLGNFGTSNQTINGGWTETGTWFDYFSGKEFEVTNSNQTSVLKPGEWHLYTNQKISDGFPGVVEIYQNPVTISPEKFTADDEVTITFDAKKAWKNGTSGLVGAEKVYIHSGLVTEHPDSTNYGYEVGNLIDDGVGEMTSIGNDIWEIVMTARDYFGLDNEQEAFKIGMYFRDAQNENFGYGFRDSKVFFDLESSLPFITIEPAAFDRDTEITVRFNARKGNGELIDADKVYMHTGVGVTDTDNPVGVAWTNVVGNWGQDDGQGEMTEVEGTDDLWEIVFKPGTFYGMETSDFPFWIACVFRNADGSLKGTGTPGPVEHGFIDGNLDFYLENQWVVSANNLNELKGRIFPNPTRGLIHFKDFEGKVMFEIFDINGKRIHNSFIDKSGDLKLNLDQGLYFYKISSKGKVNSSILIIK